MERIFTSKRIFRSIILLLSFLPGVYMEASWLALTPILTLIFFGSDWFLPFVSFSAVMQYLYRLYDFMTIDFAIYSLIGFWALIGLIKKKKFYLDKWTIMMGMYLGLILIGGLNAIIRSDFGPILSWDYKNVLVEIFLTYAAKVVFSLTLYSELRSREETFFTQNSKNLIVVSLIAYPVITYELLRKVSVEKVLAGFSRFTVGYGDPNFLAVTIVNFLIIGIFAVFYVPKLKKLMPIFLVILPSLEIILLTGSRGGTLTAIIMIILSSILCYKFFSRIKDRSDSWYSIALITLSFVLLIYVLSKLGYTNIILKRFQDSRDLYSLTSSRNLQYLTFFEIIRQSNLFHLLFGWGGTSYTFISFHLAKWQKYHVMHNSMLELIVERGLLSFFLYILIVFRLFGSAIKFAQKEKKALVLLSILLFLNVSVVHSLSLNWLDNELMWFLVPFISGWISKQNAVQKVVR